MARWCVNRRGDGSADSRSCPAVSVDRARPSPWGPANRQVRAVRMPTSSAMGTCKSVLLCVDMAMRRRKGTWDCFLSHWSGRIRWCRDGRSTGSVASAAGATSAHHARRLQCGSTATDFLSGAISRASLTRAETIVVRVDRDLGRMDRHVVIDSSHCRTTLASIRNDQVRTGHDLTSD